MGRNLTLPPDLDKRVGAGHPSMQIQEIVVADHEGRVSHLYFQEEATYTGTYDSARQRVKRTDDPARSTILRLI